MAKKGYLLMRLRRPQEALAAYMNAWNLVARHPEQLDQAGPALRGQAVALVEMGDLAGGEKLLRDSLILEPANNAAKHELAYIEGHRSGAVKPANAGFTVFSTTGVQSFKDQPKDAG